MVGDDVEMEVIDEAQKKGNITGLLPRHSELIRPAVANVDQALVIFAICKPQPNFNLLDRFLIMMQQQDIPCIICFNKQDIDAEGKKEDYRSIYAFRNWVQERVKYPAIAQENGIQGKVIISFVVNTDGSVSNIEVLRTPDRTLSDEAVRIIKSSPKWTAAKQRNKSVRQKFVIPIDFRISD